MPFVDTPSRLYIGLNIGVAGQLRVGSRQRKVEVKGQKSEEAWRLDSSKRREARRVGKKIEKIWCVGGSWFARRIQ